MSRSRSDQVFVAVLIVLIWVGMRIMAPDPNESRQREQTQAERLQADAQRQAEILAQARAEVAANEKEKTQRHVFDPSAPAPQKVTGIDKAPFPRFQLPGGAFVYSFPFPSPDWMTSINGHGGTRLTKADLKFVVDTLEQDHQIVSLRIYNLWLEDDTLSALAPCARLKELTLSTTNAGDWIVDDILALKTLEKIQISHCFISQRGTNAIASLPALKELDLSGCPLLGNGNMQELADSINKGTERILTLHKNIARPQPNPNQPPEVTPPEPPLPTIASLDSVRIDKSPDGTLMRIQPRLETRSGYLTFPSPFEQWMHYPAPVTAVEIIALQCRGDCTWHDTNVPPLERLSLRQSDLPGPLLVGLVSTLQVKHLEVANCPVSNETLFELVHCPSLTHLTLTRCIGTSRSAMELFQQLRPQIQVDFKHITYTQPQEALDQLQIDY